MDSKLQTYVAVFVTAMIVVIEIGVSFNSTLLPFVQGEFAVSPQMVQLSVALGLLALGCSGLAYGGLSESYGRRPLILVGLTVFSLSTCLASFATNIYLLILLRFLQGLGAGVGWIVGNACFKDLFHGKKYSQVMNHVHAVAGIVPAVAPIIASALVTEIGWRYCNQLVFILALVVTACNYFYLPETNLKPRPTSPQRMLNTYCDLLRSKEYIRYTIVKVLCVMLIFCEVSNIPLIFINHLGVTASHYGFYVAAAFLAYIVGTIASGHLCRFIPIDHLLLAGLGLIAASNTALLAGSALADLSPIAIQGVKAFSYLGWGFIFGNATACIVSSSKESPGSASALMIALEMLFSSLGIYLLGFYFNGTMQPLSIFMVVVACICLLSFTLLKPRQALEGNLATEK